MALLTGPATSDQGAVRPFRGADAVLAAQAARLPQPDQLCGPFAAAAALHAVLPDPPDVVEVARLAGTAIWPHDVAAWRPAGAPLDRTGWDVLPHAASAEDSGTDGTGLLGAIGPATGDRVVAVPASGPGWTADALGDLLGAVHEASYAVGVVANVRTGPLAAGDGAGGGPTWDVGHFVVLWGTAGPPGAPTHVAVADTYRELGEPGAPPGCRLVPLGALAAGLAAPPGRGLLLLVAPADAPATRALVEDAGLRVAPWRA
ncbi:hypothetical protein H5V45_11840 [Nocardioides sp. KIGAM211]|uniref:Uncharacterized protein n=1 Tax=Nocardioides luti TaxID=2761101 RepID=A0A7X0RJ38_9ACTN|nr:hypothetical protein [Nocardioides luti]MBB6628009.1 hypothetical protein [Nocardioides luti]